MLRTSLVSLAAPFRQGAADQDVASQRPQVRRRSLVSLVVPFRNKKKSARRANSRVLFQDAKKAPAVGGCVDLREPHSEQLLPPEVLLFEPTAAEIFQGVEGRGTRQIFLNTPLVQEEVASLGQLHQALQSEALVTDHGDGDFPPYVALHALRLLQQKKFNVKRTVDLILVHLEERVRRLPIAEKDVLLDLRNGFMYWHGRDRQCRPCLVIRIERMGELNQHKERAVRLVIFVLEYALRYAMAPGRVENWVVILDLHNASKAVSMLHLASVASTAKMIATTLESVYCGRMTWMKIINMPSVMRRIVESCIPSEKKVKVQFPTDVALDLARHFEPNQLEARYGGTAPDLAPAATYPFHFFPGATQGSADIQPKSLHGLTTRAFHEGRLWDTSAPDRTKRLVADMRHASLTPAAATALSNIVGGAPVKPCQDLAHLTSLLHEGELAASREPSIAQSEETDVEAPLGVWDENKDYWSL